MKLRKSQDFYGHWIVEIEEKHPFVQEVMWIPLGEFTNQEQADAVIKEMQDQEKFKPVYEFFNSGSQEPHTADMKDIKSDFGPVASPFLESLNDDEEN